jgi:ribosome-associated protein
MAKSNALTGSATKRAKSGAAPARTRRPAAAKATGAESAKTAVARRAPKFPRAVAGAVQAALDKKAEDVVVLDLRKADGFTDYFIICTGGNPRQVNAIADGVRDTLKRDFEERAALAEGIDRSEWILLDYFDFVVHVFSRDCRAFYGLERLWGAAERHEFTDHDTPRH